MCKSQWVCKPKNFENWEQVVPFREKDKASFRDFSQAQDTWDHHEDHTENELTVIVYKPYEETCNEEKVTGGGNGRVFSPSKKNPLAF